MAQQLFNNKMKFLVTIIFLIVLANSFAQTKNIKVYVFAAEECPVSIYMTKSLATISDSYKDNADFYLVFPLKSSTGKTANNFKTKNKLTNFFITVDAKQTLTKKLGAKITPEVVVANEADSVLYRGRINDAYLEPGKRRHIYSNNDLADALALITAQKQVPVPWKPAVGCYITFNKK
jgi:Thioredoxin-like domain